LIQTDESAAEMKLEEFRPVALAQSELFLLQKRRIDDICLSPFGNIAADIDKFTRCTTFRANIRGNRADQGKTAHAAVPVCHAAPRANVFDESAGRTIAALCADPQLIFIIHFLSILILNRLKFNECLTRLCFFRQSNFHQFTNLLRRRKMIMCQNLPYTLVERHIRINSDMQFVTYFGKRFKLCSKLL
jgi:hypothetical protein